jgi:hypothetical protein
MNGASPLSRDQAVKLIAERHFPRWTREHSEYFVDDLIALGVFVPRPKNVPPPLPDGDR